MSTIYEKLSEPVTPAQVEETLQQIRAGIGDGLSEVDLQDPVLVSLWLGPVASLLASHRNLQQSVATYGRLSAAPRLLIADPHLQAELIEQQAIALGLSQADPGYAIGEVTMTFSSARSRVLPNGTRFNAGFVQYVVTAPVILRAHDELTGEQGELPLKPDGAGRWTATVSVQSVIPGEVANIAEGTAIAVPDIPDVVSAWASGSFVGGRSQFELQDLVDQMLDGTAARTLGTRDQITAFLRSRTELGEIRQVGVIGFGDPEMQRDRVFGFPLGGNKADIYIASRDYPTQHARQLIATVTSVSDTTTTYSLPIGRNDSPGYLHIASVSDGSGKSLEIVSETRGFDLTPIEGELTPDIATPEQAGYSRYQTATVQLRGPRVAMSVGGELPVTVRFQRISGIATAQSLLGGRRYGYVGGDTLVRAAIPMYLKLHIRLESPTGQGDLDYTTVAEAVVAEVSRRPMRTRWHQSDFTAAIQARLPVGVKLTSIDFDAEILLPSGDSRCLDGVGSLNVPMWSDLQATPRTIAAYCSLRDVTVRIEQTISYDTP